MIDETDISQEKSFFYKQRAQKVIENLKKRKMGGVYAANRQEALSLVMEMIPPGAVVARGDSISLDQIGLLEEIVKRNQNAVIDPFQIDEDGRWPEESARQKMMRETFFADIFITGTNAITLDGKLVNIDGAGNRVAAMIFGPAKVILVMGANKIVKDTESALERIHQYAAPVNAKRHALKHYSENLGELPCVLTGSCIECKSDWKICNYTVIIDGAMPSQHERISVVLVGEDLGI
ncbi:MAG: lactate utilization protein [Dehalococcoidales bacterium]|nr:lactate utilization protein [Dehalococcoidales bacterium]